MIECLSCESWINPQVDFLVFLQNIRIAHFENFNNLFLSITVFGEFWLPTLISAIIYWCFDSKVGTYLLSLFGLNLVCAQLFKMLACVYRPWILSSKVQPAKEAFTYALGYSFPSGHSATSAAVYGGIAYSYRKKHVLAILLILLILSVGFSRMWLGVHTPQDVVTGLFIGGLLVFIMNYLVNLAEKNKNLYLYLLGIIDIFACSALIYICYFNQYPCDYVNGKLLVDSSRAVYASIICYGFSLGLINGAFLTRRFAPFDAKDGSIKTRIVRGLVGGTCLFLMIKVLLTYVFTQTLDYKLAFSLPLFIGLFVSAIYPLIFSRIHRM